MTLIPSPKDGTINADDVFAVMKATSVSIEKG